MNDKRRYAVVLSLIGLLMLVLNLLTVPTLSDDLLYRFEWQTSEDVDWPRMDDVIQLIPSQVHHYMVTSGRFVVHFVGQFFLNFVPFHVFHVVNAFMFMALINLSMRATRVEYSRRWMAATWLFFLLFFVIKGFHGAMLWSIGSFNYLWVLVSTLLFGLYVERVKNKSVSTVSWLMSAVAVLVGWSHEALSLPLSVAMFVYLVVHRKTVLHKALFPLFLGYMFGTLLCLSSPGIWLRVGDSAGIQSKILSGVVNLVTNIRIFYLLLLAVVWRYKTDRIQLKQHFSQWAYLYVTLFMALGIVVGCGATLERVGFYVDFISAFLLTSLLFSKETTGVYSKLTVGVWVFMVLFSVLVVACSWYNYKNYQVIKHQLLTTGKTLIKVSEPPQDDFFFSSAIRSRYVMPTVEFGFNQCYQAFNKEDINLRCAAQLYDKQRVSFLPADVVERIASDSTAYMHYELDGHQNIFVWRLPDGQKDPERLTFVLSSEDVSQLPLRQRMLVYDGSSYELDPLKFSVINVDGRRYLVFTKPVTNIFRRIETVVLE